MKLSALTLILMTTIAGCDEESVPCDDDYNICEWVMDSLEDEGVPDAVLEEDEGGASVSVMICEPGETIPGGCGCPPHPGLERVCAPYGQWERCPICLCQLGATIPCETESGAEGVYTCLDHPGLWSECEAVEP